MLLRINNPYHHSHLSCDIHSFHKARITDNMKYMPDHMYGSSEICIQNSGTALIHAQETNTSVFIL